MVQKATRLALTKILPTVLLSFTLDAISLADLISDTYIVGTLASSGHIAWFTISAITLVSPFLLGYASLVSFRINFINQM